MSYIKIERDNNNSIMISCSHPKVKKLHIYGGGTINSVQSNTVVLDLDNTERKEFSSEDLDKAINDAETFLLNEI